MAHDREDERQDLVDQTMDALGHEGLSDEDRARFEQLAEQIESPGLQDRILERYLQIGKQLLADRHPSRLDPRVLARLEPRFGDLGHIRVHTGPMATGAAEAMGARAFAIGDSDIFVGEGHYRPDTREGVGLLAHEVSHAVSPTDGMGLDGGDSPDEHQAITAEREVQMADFGVGGGDGDDDDGVGGGGGGSGRPSAQKFKIEMEDMVRRVGEVLERRARHAGETFGH